MNVNKHVVHPRANTRKRHPLDCRKRVPPTTRHLREHYPSALGTEHGVMCSGSQTQDIPPGLRCRPTQLCDVTEWAGRLHDHLSRTSGGSCNRNRNRWHRESGLEHVEHMIVSPRSQRVRQPKHSPPQRFENRKKVLTIMLVSTTGLGT